MPHVWCFFVVACTRRFCYWSSAPIGAHHLDLPASSSHPKNSTASWTGLCSYGSIHFFFKGTKGFSSTKICHFSIETWSQRLQDRQYLKHGLSVVSQEPQNAHVLMSYKTSQARNEEDFASSFVQMPEAALLGGYYPSTIFAYLSLFSADPNQRVYQIRCCEPSGCWK